jgi:hypothetical protein
VKALALCAAFLIGCTAPGAAPVVAQTGSSPAGTFSPGLATVPVGIVMSIQVSAASSRAVTATIDDPTVATVAPTTRDGEFVIVGTAVGQTTVHLFVDDSDASDLTVEVTPRAP